MTRVLHVEDDDVDSQWVRRALSACAGVTEVVRAGSVQQARLLMEADSFDALVVDLTLPDTDPKTTLPTLLAGHDHLPVVVLTGCLDDEFASAAIASGVQDYLVKGEAAPGALSRALRFALARCQRQAEVEAMALNDPLTGVANRLSFELRLDQLLVRRASQQEQTLTGVALIDIDEFKPMNDSRGHAFGDSVLKALANLLTENVRHSDTVARLGGDEFVVILRELIDIDHASHWMDRLYHTLSSGVLIGGEYVPIGVSTGLAFAPLHGTDRAELVAAADRAMYTAKRGGRGRWLVCDGARMQAATPVSSH